MKTVGVVLGPSNFKADVKCALSDLSKRKEINLPFVPVTDNFYEKLSNKQVT